MTIPSKDFGWSTQNTKSQNLPSSLCINVKKCVKFHGIEFRLCGRWSLTSLKSCKSVVTIYCIVYYTFSTLWQKILNLLRVKNNLRLGLC